MDGLDQLFTQKDYSTVQVSIPCYKSNDCDLINNATDHDSVSNNHPPLLLPTGNNNISIDLVCSQAASTDYYLTGQILWPVSVLLAHYLASERGQSLLKGRRVVELGAGCGLPSLVACHFGASVVVTDGNDIVLDLLKENIANVKSQQPSADITARHLIWGKRSHLDPLSRHPIDVIVAADVVQWPSVVEPLLQTVKALLWSSLVQQQQQQHDSVTDAPSTPVFLLGIVNRAQSTFDLFFRLADELGFVWQVVPLGEFLQDGIVPATCRESGGRITEVYELRLLLPNGSAVLPLLLQPRHATTTTNDQDDESPDDFIVGTSYENTMFLPF
jgi:hypothetical protein